MIFRWLVLFVMCVSCSMQETSRNPHQNSVDKDAGTPQYQSSCQQLLTGSLSPLCRAESLSSEEAIALLYSSEIIYNPEVFYNEMLEPIFWQVNQIALSAKNNQQIDSLVKKILLDCQLNRMDSCKIFRRLAPINNTYDILLYHLQNNSTISNVEDFLVLTDATLFNRSALPLISEIAARASHLKRDARLISLVNTYLSVYGQKIPSEQTKILLRYVNRINGSYLNLLSREELIIQINELHQQLPFNFFQKMQAVRPALAKSLDLQPLSKDPILKLIDLVESHQLDISESRDILLKLTTESLLTANVKNFMRWTFAYQLQITNTSAKSIIKSMNVGSNDLFDRFQFEADGIRRIWAAYKYQQQTLVNSLSRSNISSTTKDALGHLTRSLDQSIKIHSEYPHMFYLATYLSQQDFSKTVRIGTVRVDMSSNSIFNEIVNPLRTKLSWFKYTEDYFPLNDLLIRNSLSYMIRSDFFSAMGIPTENFLTYFLKNLNSLYIERYHRELVIMNNFIDTDGTYERINELCNQKTPVVKIDFERLKFGLLLSTFETDTFSGAIEVMKDSYMGGSTGYMPFDQRYIPDYYEYARTGLSYYQRILNLIDSSLKKTGRSSTVITNALSDIETKRNYTNTSFRKWRSIGDCSLKIISEERKIITYVYEQEQLYLEQVHQDIQRLRTTDSDRVAQAIFDKYKSVASYLLEDLVPLNVQSLDVISKDGYLATQFNFYARVAHHLKSYKGDIRLRVDLPPDVKKSVYYSYRDLQGNTSTVRPYFIPFQNSISDFTRFFCDAYFANASSFTLWLSFSSHASKLTDFLRSQTTSLAIGNLPVADYLASFKKIVGYYKIQPTEREILGNLNRRELLMVSVYDDIFLRNAKNGIYDHKLGLFDLTLTYLNEDILGYDYWATKTLSVQDVQRATSEETSIKNQMPLRRGLKAEAEIFFDTLRDPTTSGLLFGLDRTIIQGEYSALKEKLSQRQSLIDSFRGAAQQEDLSNVFIDIFTNDTMSGPLFSPYILDNYAAKDHEFHQRTNGCFRPLANCF